MKENSINLEFSLPPSVNECYAGYPKRHKSNKYKTWLALAWLEIQKQTQYTITWNKWLKIKLNVFLPLYYKNGNKKKQDLDNFIKPTLDFLWHNLAWFKDEHIQELESKKFDSEENIVKIVIKEIVT